MKKRQIKLTRSLVLAAILSLALVLAACSGTDPANDTTAADTTPVSTTTETEETASGETTTEATDDEVQTFTLEELAQYDGQDGRKAYIAVDGVVYDVSNIPQWVGGFHAGGRFPAGEDYTDGIRSQSPHGISMLSRAVEVGILVDE